MRSAAWHLIGRDREFDELLALLGPSPPRRGVVLLGEPGIGKTRLLGEFSAALADTGFALVRATGQPGLEGVPAGAFLGALPTAPPVSDPGELLWWLKNAISSAADRVVVVLDDAHLADPMSFAVCRTLVDEAQAVVVAAARSTEREPEGLSTLCGSDYVSTIRLQVLAQQDTAHLVRAIEGNPVEDAATAEIHRLTGGVPLAIRELVRAAAEAGFPVSAEAWTWTLDIADDAELGSLFSRRFERLTSDAKRVLWLLAAAGRPVPPTAATVATSSEAVEETIARGLTAIDDGLWWTHPLIGAVAGLLATSSRLAAAGRDLLEALHVVGLDGPDHTLLAAALDMERPSPDPILQVEAARAAVNRGLNDAAVRHAEMALRSDPDSFDARFLRTQARVLAGESETVAEVHRLLDVAPVERRLETVTTLSLLIVTLGRERNFVIEACESWDLLTRSSAVRSRIDYLRLVAALDTVPTEEFVRRAREFIDADDTEAVDRSGAQGLLSIVLSALGEIEGAQAMATAAQTGARRGAPAFDQHGPYYGGGLALLFGGDAIAAQAAVEAGAALLPKGGDAASRLGHETLALTMCAPIGRPGSGMAEWVAQADRVGSSRYSVMMRVYASWELALQRDPAADRMWRELQDSPPRIRQGVAFLEALAGVAVQAAGGDVAGAAAAAIELASIMAPVRSASAWLLHDAARHGRAADVVDDLDAIAESQPARHLPAVFADSARAIAAHDAAALVAAASEFRERGFSLFAAESEVLAASCFGADSKPGRAAIGRARSDRVHTRGAWTPILDSLDAIRLTARQRQVCHLAAAGMTNAEIADRLVISRRTVENHLYQSYAVLGVDRAGLSDLGL